ncbi:MAG: HlyD family efflux transporter periplasmic adaptor subunit [Pseudomonadota bacterium]|nr:HlyD family efflux transporter periplasmic adaptor subunit [Pseudomonadota bacterium]
MFRSEVIEGRKGRLHGDVSLAVPLSWQAIGLLLFAALIGAVIFLVAAPYSRVETVSGAIVIDKGTASILPTRAGVIAGLAVGEGQRVGAGQVLARIRAEEDLAAGSTAPQRVIESLRAQDRQLESQAGLVLDAASAEQARLLTTAAGLRREVATLDQQIADQGRLLALASEEFERVQAIATKGFISRRDVEAREATLLSRRQQLAQLHQARAAKLSDLAEGSRTIAQSEANAHAQAAAVQAQRTELDQQIAQFDSAKGYVLASPIAGTVTAITGRVGQPAIAGQQLMVIVPSGGRTSVELHVPTSAAGFLRPGQEVRLAVDAFPYQQFGTVPARIRKIATAPTVKQGGDGGALPYYIVTAELDRVSVRAFGNDQPLMPGMTLTARIVTRRQSLLEYLFEPLFALSRR